MDREEGVKAVFATLALVAALMVGFTEWGERVGSTIANPIGEWGYALGGFSVDTQRAFAENARGYDELFHIQPSAEYNGTGVQQLGEREAEMDDALGFVLYVLFGILGIFILVRIVKAASRTVNREQAAQREPAQVRLGMTPAEVESALGQPETRADLGEKLIYRYKGLTVEFTGGRVSDVR